MTTQTPLEVLRAYVLSEAGNYARVLIPVSASTWYAREESEEGPTAVARLEPVPDYFRAGGRVEAWVRPASKGKAEIYARCEEIGARVDKAHSLLIAALVEAESQELDTLPADVRDLTFMPLDRGCSMTISYRRDRGKAWTVKRWDESSDIIREHRLTRELEAAIADFAFQRQAFRDLVVKLTS